MEATPNTKRSASIGDLAKRMAAAQAQVRNLDEKGLNKGYGGGYGYVKIGQVMAVARPALADAGVAFFTDTRAIEYGERRTSNNNVMKTATVELELILVASESGEWISLTFFGEGEDSTDKAVSKAYSAALKTAFMKTLAISSSDEDEPDATTNEPGPTRSRGQRSQRSRPPMTDRDQEQAPTPKGPSDAWKAAKAKYDAATAPAESTFHQAVLDYWKVAKLETVPAGNLARLAKFLEGLTTEAPDDDPDAVPDRDLFLDQFPDAVEKGDGLKCIKAFSAAQGNTDEEE